MGDTPSRHQPGQGGEIGRTFFVGSALLQGDTGNGAPSPIPVSPCSRPTHRPSHQTPTHPPTPALPGGENRSNLFCRLPPCSGEKHIFPPNLLSVVAPRVSLGYRSETLRPPPCPCLSLLGVSLIAHKGYASPMGDTPSRHQPGQGGEIGRTFFVGSALLQGDTGNGAPSPIPVSPCSRPTHRPSHQTPTHPPTPALPGGENRSNLFCRLPPCSGEKHIFPPNLLSVVAPRVSLGYRFVPMPSLRLAPSRKGR